MGAEPTGLAERNSPFSFRGSQSKTRCHIWTCCGLSLKRPASMCVAGRSVAAHLKTGSLAPRVDDVKTAGVRMAWSLMVEVRTVGVRTPEVKTVGVERIELKISPANLPRRRSAERRAEARRTPASRRRSTRVGLNKTADHPLSVTVSIGVSEPDTKARAPEQVIQAADKALYRAKQSGRNRVEPGLAPRPAKPKRNIA